jgi:Transposase DDE domain
LRAFPDRDHCFAQVSAAYLAGRNDALIALAVLLDAGDHPAPHHLTKRIAGDDAVGRDLGAKMTVELSRWQAGRYRDRPLNPRALMPYKANEPRRHKIPKARYKIDNWAEDDAALRRRGSLTVWVTSEAITAWAPAVTGRRGRPRNYSDVAIETGLMLRLAFGRPWRQTEGMLRSIIDLLGLELTVPDHTTFSRRSTNLRVAAALKKADGPVHVVIDSTLSRVLARVCRSRQASTVQRCRNLQ